ncbi:putative transcription factor WRKY family [Dioscorea sansibarensis]
MLIVNVNRVMDDIASQILHGCKLAGELEVNLPNLLNQSQHNLLIDSCEQVAKTFIKAIQQLRSSGHGFIVTEKTFDVAPAGATIGQEDAPLEPPEKQMGSPNTSESVEMIKARIGPASAIRRGEEPSTDAAVMLIGTSGESSFGVSSMTSNKMKKRFSQRRRMLTLERNVTHAVDVPADSSDDGYIWRKYGEKFILGAKFPREADDWEDEDLGHF